MHVSKLPKDFSPLKKFFIFLKGNQIISKLCLYN